MRRKDIFDYQLRLRFPKHVLANLLTQTCGNSMSSWVKTHLRSSTTLIPGQCTIQMWLTSPYHLVYTLSMHPKRKRTFATCAVCPPCMPTVHNVCPRIKSSTLSCSCQEFNMTLNPSDLPVIHYDAHGADRRGSDHDRRTGEQKISDGCMWPRIADAFALVVTKLDSERMHCFMQSNAHTCVCHTANWPSIPGCGPDSVWKSYKWPASQAVTALSSLEHP